MVFLLKPSDQLRTLLFASPKSQGIAAVVVMCPETCIMRWTGIPALSSVVTEVALIQWFV